jgi:carnitine-CoA ligase
MGPPDRIPILGAAGGAGRAHSALAMTGGVIGLVNAACPPGDPRPALIFEDGVAIARGDLRSAVGSFGAYLAERIKPGERVAVMSENRIEFMIAWLGTIAAGGLFVSINHGAREHDAGHVLRDSQAAVVVAGPSCRALIERLAPDLPALREVVAIGDPEPEGLAQFAGSRPLDLATVAVDPRALTNIYYTSGTTGPPKGCMLGHDYWLRFVELYGELYGFGAGDRLLCCLQFFYGDPPWLFLVSLHGGSPLIATRRFSVSRFWDLVRREQVTRLFGLASIPALLLKAPPSERDRDQSVTMALQVGVPTSLHRQINERWGFPWVEGYGLTETGLVISMPLDEAEAMTASGSIGLPCPGVEVRLLDDEGRDVGEGDPGELVVKAPGMFRAYLGMPDATAETLRDGWLHTGDLARADARGFLYFLGRKKDIVRRSGENVAATEVEDVLRSHPGVREAVVLPVADDLRGEEIKALIELVDDLSADDVTPAALVEHCRERLAKHKVPRYVAYCTEPFPRAPSMRVKKSELLTPALLSAAGAWDRERELGW